MTTCCTSTSSGLSGDSRFSTRPSSAARRAAAASISSIVWVGTSVRRLARPGAWPLRPARCRMRATPFGEPICSTRSTGRKSTPRSSDEVATTARSRPALRPSSTHSRVALSIEPWCNAISPAHSGFAASSSWYQISAWERTLVKTSVVPDFAISSTTGCCMRAPRWPAQEYLPGSGGISVSITSFLSMRPRTSFGSGCGSGPQSTAMACSRLPSVALKPQVTSLGLKRRSRARASCVCTPRLLPISSCHSSTTTYSTLRSSSRGSLRVSISVRDSGVVTSTVGKRRSCRARSALEVSPVRWPMLQVGASAASGSVSARVVSEASARIGVSQSTRKGSATTLRPWWSAGGWRSSKAASMPSQTA